MAPETHALLPVNLHVYGAHAEGTRLPERVEQKFFVPPRRMSRALGLLRAICCWDEHYPEEQINSLYFDTADLDQHERSLAGEFAKDKIRIRWYGAEHDPHKTYKGSSAKAGEGETIPVWLELKSRRGSSAFKQRQTIVVSADALSSGALAKGVVPLSTLVETMAAFGFFSTKKLHPVIAVSYWRCRFVEPRTGLRVAFDSHIRSSVVMPGLGRGERALQLAGAVIEVKGPSADLPLCLRSLREIGSFWTRYSKYSSSLDAHESKLGSVSRLWPSGTVHAEPSTSTPKPKGEATTCGSK